jgi:methionine-rich copper-binding protein CopC
MRLRQGGLRRVARTVLRALAAALVTLVAMGATTTLAVTETVLRAAPAGAHARVVGTSPEDHAHLETMPDRVTIRLSSKPPTVEGDPMRVYGPTGERVDDGSVQLAEGSDGQPDELSVGLVLDDEMPTGEYHVVYRIVSDDTHLIAGRLMLHFGEPDRAALLSIGSSPEDPEHMAPGWPADPAHWPKLVLVGGVAAGLAGLACQRWRRGRRDRDFGARVLSAGLFAGRRLD